VTDYTLFDPAAYQLTLPDGRAFLISQTDGLQRITDLSGNVLTVGRNGITHSSGRGVSFVRNPAGAITSVVDPMGRATGFGYGTTGDLASVTDREGHTTRLTVTTRFSSTNGDEHKEYALRISLPSMDVIRLRNCPGL
jgi:YD repeat-containing protein